MPGFFKGMVPQVKEFVAKRRIRLAPVRVPDSCCCSQGWLPGTFWRFCCTCGAGQEQGSVRVLVAGPQE
jgi:hypothetical protein